VLDLYRRIDGLTTFQCSCLYFQSKLAMTGRPVRCGIPLRGPPVKQFRTHVYLSSFSCFWFLSRKWNSVKRSFRYVSDM